MGLDLECGEMYIRVGSYTTVHKLRSVLVRCTYEYIKNKENNTIQKNLIEHLEKIIIGDTYVGVFASSVGYKHIHNNYSEIHRLLLNYNCEGLLLFVCHSDCEGYHSVNEVKKIIEWLKQILSFEKSELILYKNNFIDEMLKPDSASLYERFYLTKIFEYSLEINQQIEYC
jgi:hypothetical protein